MLRLSFGGVELADGNLASSSIVEMRDGITGKALVQTEQLIRAGQPIYFDRLSRSNAFRVKVTKQVSSHGRAMDLSLRGRQTLPAVGVLVFTLVESGVVRTWTAARAKCEQMEPVPGPGLTVSTTYHFECGTFTYSSTETETEPATNVDGGTVDDMGTQILMRGGTRAEILAAIAAETFNDREPWIETDGGRSGVGNKGADAAVKDLGTIAITTAGETTLALVTWATVHRALITVAAGAYTRNIVLPESATGLDASTLGFVAGDTIEARVEMAIDPSSDVIVNFYHNVASGTALLQLTSDAAGARNYVAQFRFNGSAWALWDVRQINA